MKFISVILLAVISIVIASDVARDAALTRWYVHDAAGGMRMIAIAGRINPYSPDVRLDQIESLWNGYRQDGGLVHLHEAVLISRSMVRDYPGSVQNQEVYSAALIYEATHSAQANDAYKQAAKAIEFDPISVANIERLMFLLSAKRISYSEFLELGIKRSRLTGSNLSMNCELCGRPWLRHK